MNAVLLKTPNEVSFAGNPMPFSFGITPYGTKEQAEDIRLRATLLIEVSYNSNVFIEARTIDVYPDVSGNVNLDVQSIVRAYLEYYTPKPGLSRAIEAADQRKRYKVTYELLKDNIPVDNIVVNKYAVALTYGTGADFIITITPKPPQPIVVGNYIVFTNVPGYSLYYANVVSVTDHGTYLTIHSTYASTAGSWTGVSIAINNVLSTTTVTPTIQESPVFYALKGGLSYEQWHPSDFFNQIIVANKQPLHFAAKGEKVFFDDVRFLFWCYPLDDNAAQTIRYDIFLSDGTTATVTAPLTIICGKWGICCVPSGFTQAGLAGSVPTGLYAIKYSITVTSGSTTIVDAYTYTLDYRNFYRTYQLIYRNSLGALETVRLRGQVDFEADYAITQALRVVPPSYYSNLNLLPQQVAENTEEQAKLTGDTGFISREMVMKLRDLFLSPEIYELDNGKLLPVVLNSKNTKFFSNKDNLISTQVQWQRAFSNYYFTPTGLMPTTRTCPAVQQFSVTQYDKNNLQIMYALETPYDIVAIDIATDSGFSTIIKSAQIDGNTISAMLQFPNPATTDPVNIWVRARTVCNEDIEPADYGTATVIELSVHGDSLPVAVNDVYNINEGFADFTTLTGSVLDNDYDPDNGDAIEVVTRSGVTSQGGQYTINAAGIVTYKPPSQFWYGADQFIYELRNVGGTITVPGTVTINVGQASVNVFARVVVSNTRRSGSDTYGTVSVYFYSDQAGTIPVDISQFHLTLNVLQTNTERLYSGSGPVQATTTWTRTFFPTGNVIVIYSDGPIYYNSGFLLWTSVVFTIAAGNGYTGIL